MIRFLACGAALACLASAAETVLGQQPQRAQVIGYLSGLSKDDPQPCIAAFRKGLAQHGLIEDDNVVINVRYADSDEKLLFVRARELVALKPDLLVSAGLSPIVALRAATGRIPIVTLGTGSMVRAGVIKSLARPGSNVTGYSLGEEEHGLKPFELLAQALPQAKTIGFLRNANNPAHQAPPTHEIATAERLGRRLVVAVFSGKHGIEEAWNHLVTQGGVDAIVIAADRRLYIREHARQAVRHKIPAISIHRVFVQAGGLMSYGIVDRIGLCKEGARYAAEILRGRKAQDMPVEELRESQLVLNLKAAQMLNVSFPPELIARAVELVE